MAALRDIKKKIVEESIREGRSTATGKISQQWIDGLSRSWESRWRENPRLVNRFKLGVAVQVDGLNFQRTNGFLKVSRITGMSEVRTVTSRRVLDLVAAMGRGLQFAMRVNGSPHHKYQSGAMGIEYPLGSRVFFERTIPTQRLREVSALDEVMELMLKADVWSIQQQGMRNQWKRTPLGLPGDWKPSQNGWEYRSFPSFVHSPWEMLLTLTLAKLAVCRPDLVLGPGNCGLRLAPAENRIKFILSYFRGIDDDAELCWEVLKKYGLPKKIAMNSAWGLQNLPSLSTNGVLEDKIRPEASSVETLWHHIMENLPMQVVGEVEKLIIEIPKGWRRDWSFPRAFKREGEIIIPEVKFGRYPESSIYAPSWWLRKQSMKLKGITTSSDQERFGINRAWAKKNPRRLEELFLDGSIGRWTLAAVLSGGAEVAAKKPHSSTVLEVKY